MDGGASPKIVVEGWIEEGDFAQVLLSSSIPVAGLLILQMF